jgi:hypothetical protein
MAGAVVRSPVAAGVVDVEVMTGKARCDPDHRTAL